MTPETATGRHVDAVMTFHAKVSARLGYDAPPVMLAIDDSGTATSRVYLPRH